MSKNNVKVLRMTTEEALILIKLVEGNRIIASKAHNGPAYHLKEIAWANITANFNAKISSGSRTTAQLKLKWKNLKKSWLSRNAQGNYSDNYTFDPILDRMSSVMNTVEDYSIEEFEKTKQELTGGVAESSKLLQTEVKCEPDEYSANSVESLCIVDSSEEDNTDGKFVETPNQEEPTPKRKLEPKKTISRGIGIRKLRTEDIKARIMKNAAIAEYYQLKNTKMDLQIETQKLKIASLTAEQRHLKLENNKLKFEICNLLNNMQ